MEKVNNFFNARGNGSSSLKSLRSDYEKLNSALNSLISDRDKKDSERKSATKKISELKDSLKGKMYSDVVKIKVEIKGYEDMVSLLYSEIDKLNDEISESKSVVDRAKKALDAYEDSPVHDRDVKLSEAESTISKGKEILEDTVIKYEQKIKTNKKNVLLGLGALGVIFIAYKFLKK